MLWSTLLCTQTIAILCLPLFTPPRTAPTVCVYAQEPLKVTYRPLTFYLFAECAAFLKHTMLLAAGFKGHSYGPYTYYTYNLPTENQAAHGYDLRCCPLRPH